MFKRNFNGGGTTWPGSSSSGSVTSGGGGGGPHGNQNNQAANVINKPTVYVPTGGSDDYGIGSGGEFGGININYGSALPGGGSQEDSYDWTTDSDYGGSTYVPWQTSAEENFLSAYGGLGLYGANNDEYAWNPFVAGYDKEGEPIYLTTSQFNEMMSVGEFGILPPGGSSGGGGGGGWGGYGGYGYGGGGGGGGGGGYIEQPLNPQGNPNEAWGTQTPWQQMMINTHAGKGFQQGYARGGIVGLVT